MFIILSYSYYEMFGMIMLSAIFHMCSWFMSQHHETGRNTLIYRRHYGDFFLA
jgi:ABC-type multidrug transport system permease subunit